MATATVTKTAATVNKTTTLRDIFREMPAKLIQELENLEFTTSYPSEAVLFVEEQLPRGVFMVLRGRVKLSVCSRDGKTLTLRIAKTGEVLGVSASIAAHAYEATAETLEASQLREASRHIAADA